MAFFPDLFPSKKHPFNSTLAQQGLQEQNFNAAGSERFLREAWKGEKCAILPSAGSRGNVYPREVRALDRHDLLILEFKEHDYAVRGKI